MDVVVSRVIKVISITTFLIGICLSTATAQFAFSSEIKGHYEMMPYAKLSDPAAGTFLEGLEVRSTRVGFEAAHPFMLDQGWTFFISQLGFEYLKLDYRNWDVSEAGGGPKMTDLYSANVTFLLMRILNQKWSLLGIVSPGVASDFEGALTFDDFNFQAGMIFYRGISQHTQIGFGVFYSTTFGEPIPLPALSLNWNNGSNMGLDIILPVQIQYKYAAHPKLDLGILMTAIGNDYRGSSEIYGVENPRIGVSDWTIGPTLDYNLTSGLSLNVYGGYTFVREFGFNDSDDEIQSYDLKGSPFIRVGMSFSGPE